MKKATSRSSRVGVPVLRSLGLSAAALTLLASASLFTTAYAQLPAPQTTQGVQYITGGFGQEESTAFKEAKSRYPLALTFAATGDDGSTPYVADVQLEITDAQGNAVVSLPSVGPYLLVELKPGAYTLKASYQGQTQTKKVDVAGPGSVDARIAWKRSVSGPD